MSVTEERPDEGSGALPGAGSSTRSLPAVWMIIWMEGKCSARTGGNVMEGAGVGGWRWISGGGASRNGFPGSHICKDLQDIKNGGHRAAGWGPKRESGPMCDRRSAADAKARMSGASGVSGVASADSKRKAEWRLVRLNSAERVAVRRQPMRSRPRPFARDAKCDQ
jgi:hypothetical protein